MLDKPDHVPPHDRFFEDGEEPPERYDLENVSAYRPYARWRASPAGWFRAAAEHYFSFLKRTVWINAINLILGPDWLLGWYPCLGAFVVFMNPLTRIWLLRRSLNTLTGVAVEIRPLNTYGALLYLDIFTALFTGFAIITGIFLGMGIGTSLEYGEPWLFVALSISLVLEFFIVLALKGRLTRFATMLIVDRGMGTANAMRESWSMWRTRFWKLFALELLTFCAEFLGIAAAGFGYILVRPFVTLFWTAAYLDAIYDSRDQEKTRPAC